MRGGSVTRSSLKELQFAQADKYPDWEQDNFGIDGPDGTSTKNPFPNLQFD
jgi:hypothetical protein